MKQLARVGQGYKQDVWSERVPSLLNVRSIHKRDINKYLGKWKNGFASKMKMMVMMMIVVVVVVVVVREGGKNADMLVKNNTLLR